MSGAKWVRNLGSRIGSLIGSLSVREQVILLTLVLLVAAFGGEFLFSKLYLERRRELRDAVAVAEETLEHHERVLSREERIHAEYAKLENPVASERDSVLTETAVLRRVSELAGSGIHVTSVVPRVGLYDGQHVLLVALDFEGPLAAVLGYLNDLLKELPVVVNDLSLAPQAGGDSGVVCRTSIRIDCCES